MADDKQDQKKDEQWSDEPTKDAKYHTPEGLFENGSPEKIATTLKKDSKDRQQAMARLNFYINRAGKNLSDDDRERLEKAKEKLKALYDEEEKTVSKESYPVSLRW